MIDPDAPIRPIDPVDDARRREAARRERTRRDLGIVLLMLHPLAALVAGALLGGWHAHARVVGALALLFAWGAARVLLHVLAWMLLLVGSRSLSTRLFGPARAMSLPAPPTRWAGVVWTVQALGSAALAAVAGLATGALGDGIHAVDVVAFALAGLALGVTTRWTTLAV